MAPSRRPAGTSASRPASPGLLTGDQIRQVDDIGYEDVTVPEWGGTVRVKALSGRERIAYQKVMVQRTGSGRMLPRMEALDEADARLVQLACIDEDGKPLFTADDVTWLAAKSGAALNRVAAVARRLAGLSDEDIEELVEDFGGSPNGHSSTG